MTQLILLFKFLCFCIFTLANKFENPDTYFDPPLESALDPAMGDPGSFSSVPAQPVEGSADQPGRVFNIGGVLSKEEHLQEFLQLIDSIYYEPNVLPLGVNLHPQTLPFSTNPIKTVQGVCDKLIKKQVYVVIVTDTASAESLAVTQTCGLYRIPVIGVSNRDSAMSDKHMHPVYLRTVPPFAHQVDVWLELLMQLHWKHVVFIHSGDYDGRSACSRFSSKAEKLGIELSQVIEYQPGGERLANALRIADSLQSRVYLLYAPTNSAQNILVEAERLELTGRGYMWLLAEQALGAPNIPDGSLGVRLFGGANVSAHIRDALFIVGMALREWTESATDLRNNHSLTSPPAYCGDHRRSAWASGQRFYNVLRKQSLLYGRSGRVAFDGKGDRISADYEILNYHASRSTVVGSYAYSQSRQRMQLWINEASVYWPGGQTTRPVGYVLPDQLSVVTVTEQPFVWARPVDEWHVQNLRTHVKKVNEERLMSAHMRQKVLNGRVLKQPTSVRPWDKKSTSTTPATFVHHGMLPGYDDKGRIRSSGSKNKTGSGEDYLSGTSSNGQSQEDLELERPSELLPGMLRFDSSFIQKELCERNELLCPRKIDGKLKYYCCKGYCIDLLVELAGRLNISFNLHQSEDGQYGSFEPDANLGGRRRWNGVVGELVTGNADMVIAPLTINPERSLYIDFSKPFKYQGITIIERQQTASRASLASFMEPFEDSLWILVMVSVHVVALALYLLDRFSPFGRYRLPNCDVTEEDALNLSSAIWFAWGVLLNSGIGEGTPRSFSGRVLGMVWAGFAMIIVASYTGNLAAFLVLNRPENTLTGINDSRLRNPTDNYTYSTVKNSAVEMYFKRQMELANIYLHLMKNKPHYTVEEGIQAVRNNEINAFIWDSARLEYEASQDCELAIAAEQFGRSGYGIGLTKNSFWTERVNQAVLSMHESGFMEKLDNEWILNVSPECINRNNVRFPTTLGLRNMAGVFILVGIGIVGGIGLIVIEVIYKKQQNRKQRQLESARYAAEKWKKFVQRRRNYRTNAHHLRKIHLRNKLEQSHSQPSQDSQQPLLAASPMSFGGTGHTNPHLSLSKCNSGADGSEATESISLHPTTEVQLQIRNRKQTPRPEALLEANQLESRYPSFQMQSNAAYESNRMNYNYVNFPSSHHESDQGDKNKKSKIGSAMSSLPPHVLARSAGLTDTIGSFNMLEDKKGSRKSQKRNGPTYQQHAPLRVYEIDPSSSKITHSHPPLKTNRKGSRTAQLQHQQAVASSENLMHPAYESPSHHHTSIHSIYTDQLMNSAPYSAHTNHMVNSSVRPSYPKGSHNPYSYGYNE